MMNTITQKYLIIALMCSLSATYAQKTIFFDANKLEKNKQLIAEKSTIYLEILKKLTSEADKIIKRGKVYSVMNKTKTPTSGDKHDYMSVGPYWWPDPSKPDGLPYIRKDGERNPEYYQFSDPTELHKVEDESEILALAYFYTQKEEYGMYAAKILKTWFVNTETKMNPNLNFGQAVPGINDGRGTGIIETRGLYRVIEAANLINGSKSWGTADHETLKKWFADYLKWLLESKNGIDEFKADNNHGTYYDNQIIAFALFAEKNDIAIKQIESVKNRIKSQFTAEGKQPLELARTTSWSYTNMNLMGFMMIAKYAEKLKIDLWNYQVEGKNIKQGLEWIVPYIKKEKTWEYKQIKEIDYENTVNILKMASAAYKNPSFDELAKKLDANSYFNPAVFLTY